MRKFRHFFNALALRYIVYLRQSSDDFLKQANSCGTQESELEMFKELGFNIVAVLREKKSAFKPGRPIFNEMLDMIRRGEADGVIVYSESRISRNAQDTGAFIQLLADEKIKHVQTKYTSYTCDGDIEPLYRTLGSSHQDSRSKAGWVSDGLRYKALRGWCPRPQILGYYHIKPDKITGSQEGIEIIPESKDTLCYLWSLALSGNYTLSMLHKEAVRLGFGYPGRGTISYNGMRNMFLNEFYYGYFYWQDEECARIRLKGKHEPIVTIVEWDTVQKNLFHKANITTKPSTLSHAYRNLFRCGLCDFQIVGERKIRVRCTKCKHRFSSIIKKECPRCNLLISKMKSPNMLNKVYYRCGGRKHGCKSKYFEQDAFDLLVEEKLKPYGISERFYNLMIKVVSLANSGKGEMKNTKRTIYMKRMSELESRKSAYVDMRADGDMDKEMYRIKVDEINNNLKDLELELAKHQTKEKQWSAKIIDGCDLLRLCVDNFKDEKEKVKRLIVRKFSSNLIINENGPCITIPNHFIAIKKMEQKCIRKFKWFEPLFEPKNKAGSEIPEEISYLLAEVTKVRANNSKM